MRQAMAVAANNIRLKTMLVRPYGPLPGCKAEQQYPGEDNMVSIRFQKQSAGKPGAKLNICDINNILIAT